MWLPTAMIAAAVGAGLMAGVMAFLAVVERENRVWRYWSASFALDAARSLVLAPGPAHRSLPDMAAELLSIGHVGLLAVGVLLWVRVTGPVPAVVAGTVASALWAVAGTAAGVSEFVLHLPIDAFFVAALGLTGWMLWTGTSASERVLRRIMAVILAVWTAQELSSATVGWHGQFDAVGFTAIHGYGTAIALMLIVAVLRRRHAEALAAIEEARKARGELEQANRRLTDFARTSSDWFWEQDADLRFTYLSQSVWEHSTLKPEDHYGKTRRETQPTGVSEEAWAEHEAALHRREPFKHFRIFRRGPDGSERVLSISGVPVFDDAGVFKGYRGVGRDLTELILAEQRADTVSTRLLQAIDARSEGLAFWDADDHLVICNQAYRAQSGAAASVLVPGVTFEEYIRTSVSSGEIPAAKGREEAWIQERLARRASLPSGFELRRGEHWLLVREQQTPDGGVLLAVTDIGAMKRREEALLQAVTEAQLANRAKMAFLATMSHELRTPLNAIIGFAEIIRSGQVSSKSEVQAEYAGYIHESGTHLLSVINDLLDVSRIDSGRIDLDERPFPLSSLLDECDRMIRHRAQQEGLRLAVSPVEPGLGLRADRRAMKQILINLLSNAVKFTERGGAVTLTAEHDGEGGLRMVVCDTGIGVDNAQIAELFEPFRQLESVHARRHHGTGLGLYISKSLVEAHGGTIRFESAAGKGSTVTITLPAARVIDSDGSPRLRATA